jgi:PDZ domain-containing protein
MTDTTSGAPDPTDAGAGSGTPPPDPDRAPADPDRAAPGPDREKEARKHRRHVVIAWIASVFGVLLVAAVIAGFVIRVPYVIISPGASTPLDASVVSIEGADTYPHRQSVEFLTVRVSNTDPTVWRVVSAWLDPDKDVEKRSDVVGCLSDTDNQQFNTDLMLQSQNDAKYVALTRLGYEVERSPARLTVIQACQGVPAYGKLRVGDRVVAVDGNDVTQLSEVGAAVQSHAVGTDVTFTVERDGERVDETVVTGKASKDRTTCLPASAADRTEADGATSGSEAGKGGSEAGKGGSEAGGTVPCVGIVTQSFVDYTFPVQIEIDTQRVGGPSAGLAFTLAIIDDLTPGSLTGGKRVAVTGTISPDGRVGPVGGVQQKAITAKTNGVQLMIVPKSEVKDARKGAGGVRVVGADTLDDALRALRSAGGAQVPPPATTAARS